MTEKTAVIIGGGIAGLATACLLAKAGMKVKLFEGRERLGGRAYLLEQDGFKFDMGPSWYLMPDAFEQFFKLMGTTAGEQLNLVRLDPAYQTINQGQRKPVTVHADLSATKVEFESIEPGAGAALQRYLDSAEETYDLAVEHFLYTNFQNVRSFTHRAVRTRAASFVSHLLTSLDAFASRFVKADELRKILDFPAVFLGASPYDTPSMYHLMTHVDMNIGVFYPQGGFYEIIRAIEALARKHGVEIHTSSPVTAINVDAAGTARAVTVGDAQIEADLVVASADLQHVETKLLPERWQSYPQKWWNKRLPGPSAALVFLGVRGELPQLKHHTLLYTSDWKSNFATVFRKPHQLRAPHVNGIPSPASIYLCNPSKTDPSVAPAGHENLFVLVPIAPDPRLGGEGDPAFEAAVDTVIDQIADWCEIPDLKERIVVRRSMGPADFANNLNAWQGTALGMAHTLPQSAFFRPKTRSSKVKNLFYAGHNVQPGIGLPMCLIGAELVYKRLIGDTSAGPTQHEITPVTNWAGL
jgi:phytoene desaturase